MCPINRFNNARSFPIKSIVIFTYSRASGSNS